MAESRTKKSLLNARVSTIYLVLTFCVTFFTRKFFLDSLGTEFLGLTSTLNSILGFINITELGIGSAIAYALYHPIATSNREEINRIISLMGYFYSRIGYIILGLGILVSLFFPLIFEKTDLSLGIIYFAFYCYLSSSLLGYYVNYPSTLFSADQRGYEITKYSQAMTIVKILVNVAIAKWSGSFYLFVAFDLFMGVVSALIIQWRIKVVYPWLKSEISKGKKVLKEYSDITKNIKKIFVHKIGAFVQYQLPSVLIYAFSSLSMVTLFTNYTTITSKLSMIVNAFINSTNAGVGTLIAEGDIYRIKSVYFEMLALRFFIAGYIGIMLYLLLEPFISIWLGHEFILDHSILILILLNMYIGYIRCTTDEFIAGYGLFSDIWSPFAESLIYVIVAIVCGHYFGLAGVLTGGFVSTCTIIGIWKPYFLFSRGFKESIWQYWLIFLLHITLFLVASIISIKFTTEFPLIVIKSYLTFVLKAIYLSFIFLTIYISLLLIFTSGFRRLALRFINMIHKK